MLAIGGTLVAVVLAVALASSQQAPASAPAAGAAATPVPQAPRAPFTDWLAGVRTEAINRGLRAEVVDAALAGLEPLEQIRQRDRTQAEFVVSFDRYTARWLNRRFVRLGRERAKPHRQALAKVSARYGVPVAVVLGVWGVESNYGRFSGVRPVIASLATLAYDPRRGEFFRGQLFDALTILDNGHIDLPGLRGSWAGAMGQPQFLPSSYLKYRRGLRRRREARHLVHSRRRVRLDRQLPRRSTAGNRARPGGARSCCRSPAPLDRCRVAARRSIRRQAIGHRRRAPARGGLPGGARDDRAALCASGAGSV